MVRIIFEPDEDADDNDLPAPIPIVDDLVNEAIEQTFVVQLKLNSSVNPGSVGLMQRQASLCRIIDNDRKQNNECKIFSVLLILQPSELDLSFQAIHTWNLCLRKR